MFSAAIQPLPEGSMCWKCERGKTNVELHAMCFREERGGGVYTTV